MDVLGNMEMVKTGSGVKISGGTTTNAAQKTAGSVITQSAHGTHPVFKIGDKYFVALKGWPNSGLSSGTLKSNGMGPTSVEECEGLSKGFGFYYDSHTTSDKGYICRDVADYNAFITGSWYNGDNSCITNDKCFAYIRLFDIVR